MKKITLLFVCIFAFGISGFAQAVLLVEAPQNNGSTTQTRAPNGTVGHSYLRACALVLANELTNLPSGSTISDFGFTLQTGTSGTPVSGNFTLFLQNTNDLTYLKGTNWANIPTGMTQVFASVMTVPLSAGTSSILINLSTPFVYTGAGLYVAYDWTCTGPYSSGTIATYYAESAVLNPGCASAASSVSSPTLLANTNFRPAFLFQAVNTNTNDIQVLGVEGNGSVPVIFNLPQTVSAMVKNASNMTQNNIQVNLNVSGANVVNSNLTISSLAAGASTLVSFTAYTPSNVGLNTISVSVNSDQNNNNNAKTFAQHVKCNYLARNPGAGSYTSAAVGYGTGTGILATPLNNVLSSTLTGINFAVSNNAASVGGNIYGVLMNAAGGILATSNTITITSAMLGTFQEFTFSNPPALIAATNYVIGMAQMTGTVAYYPAGTQASGYLPNALFLTAGINGGVLTPLTQNFGYFGIEAIYQHTANVSIVASPTLICLGSSVALQANGPVTNYTWSTGSNSQSITLNPGTTTVYSVIATNSIGCKSAASLTLPVSPLPNVLAFSSSQSVCVGASVTLNAAGAASYTWNTGANGPSTVETPSVNTTYTVVGSNTAGCTNTAIVSISVSEPVFALVSSNVSVCGNNPVTLSVNGPANYSYLWSNGSPFGSITVTLAATTVFSVTATDQNNCTKTLTASIVVNPQPTVNASATRTNICRNEPETLSASGASTYSWSTSGTGSSIVITPNNTGTFVYSVTGTDANNCSNTTTVTIRVYACVGLTEFEAADFPVNIYPNPAQNDFYVSLSKLSEFVDLQIFNEIGQLVKTQVLNQKENRVDWNEMVSGLYLIKVLVNGDTKFQQKMLKN